MAQRKRPKPLVTEAAKRKQMEKPVTIRRIPKELWDEFVSVVREYNLKVYGSMIEALQDWIKKMRAR